MSGDVWLDVLWVVLIVAAWVAAILVYMAPSVVALRRGVTNRWSVVVVNLLLGWTVVGWAVALAMAVRDKPTLPPVTGV